MPYNATCFGRYDQLQELTETCSIAGYNKLSLTVNTNYCWYKYNGINSIKMARGGQAFVNNKYNNLKHKVLKCNANIFQ
jgi:hypothetical protein